MKGNDTLLGFAILALLIVVALTNSRTTNKTQNTASKNISDSTSQNVIFTSPRAKEISLGSGNASYSESSLDEYITLYNIGSEPVNITGWKLKNAKDQRVYSSGGALQHFPADIAVIGQAATYLSPTGNNMFQNIVLQDGETAIINTGSFQLESPYKVVSFKENICSGYLGNLAGYTFSPSLTTNCPRPANEPGITALDIDCQKFIENMSSCRTPKFETRDSNGDICYNCVDGHELSSICVAFIKNHFNYGSCIANHKNDKNFSGNTWRIFLGRGWEMWGKDHESISLFDQLGRLVSQIKY